MIGVVGDGGDADRVATTLEGAGIEVWAASAARLADATLEAVAAVGESALVELVEVGIDAPVLPVALDEGLPSIAVEDARRTVEAFHAGETLTRQHPLLDVVIDGGPVGRAVFDAMLVRSEPGRISEYRLSAPTADSRFRADGVVAVTPAGSHGYAQAAGGPRLGLDADAVVVVPVAAFGLGAPSWVLDPGAGLELRVERDEGDVSLLVDGRARRTLSGEAALTLTSGGTLETIVPLTD
jgi:NAD+ kinase